MQAKLFQPIADLFTSFEREFEQIPDVRKKLLADLAEFVQSKVKNATPAQLIFICTHNSRRSHLSQIWAQTAAAYYGVSPVKSFSGGTEATAFNPRAVKAMQQAGFQITTTNGNTTNPLYEIRIGHEVPVMTAFSKVYDAPENPASDFCAVMTCSHADDNCPFIPGASKRIPLTYNDPKEFDDTPLESAKYTERLLEIGRDIAYAFSLIKSK